MRGTHRRPTWSSKGSRRPVWTTRLRDRRAARRTLVGPGAGAASSSPTSCRGQAGRAAGGRDREGDRLGAAPCRRARGADLDHVRGGPRRGRRAGRAPPARRRDARRPPRGAREPDRGGDLLRARGPLRRRAARGRRGDAPGAATSARTARCTPRQPPRSRSRPAGTSTSCATPPATVLELAAAEEGERICADRADGGRRALPWCCTRGERPPRAADRSRWFARVRSRPRARWAAGATRWRRSWCPLVARGRDGAGGSRAAPRAPGRARRSTACASSCPARRAPRRLGPARPAAGTGARAGRTRRRSARAGMDRRLGGERCNSQPRGSHDANALELALPRVRSPESRRGLHGGAADAPTWSRAFGEHVAASSGRADGGPARRAGRARERFFFFIYIYIYKKKKNKKLPR